MPIYCDQDFNNILSSYQLNSFEALWLYQGEWVEEGNVKAKSGRSDVVRMRLAHGGETTIAYMKRQENYRTNASRLLHKPRAICAREFENIQAWHVLGLPTMDALYFAQQDDPLRAILITRDLTGFVPLDEWLVLASDPERMKALKETARLLRRLHDHQWLHRCFFPKHVFIRQVGDTFELRMIDLEKARKTWISPGALIDEITQFYRRMIWKAGEAQTFLLTYFNVDSLSRWQTFLVKRIEKRTQWKKNKYYSPL